MHRYKRVNKKNVEFNIIPSADDGETIDNDNTYAPIGNPTLEMIEALMPSPSPSRINDWGPAEDDEGDTPEPPVRYPPINNRPSIKTDATLSKTNCIILIALFVAACVYAFDYFKNNMSRFGSSTYNIKSAFKIAN